MVAGQQLGHSVLGAESRDVRVMDQVPGRPGVGDDTGEDLRMPIGLRQQNQRRRRQDPRQVPLSLVQTSRCAANTV